MSDIERLQLSCRNVHVESLVRGSLNSSLIEVTELEEVSQCATPLCKSALQCTSNAAVTALLRSDFSKGDDLECKPRISRQDMRIKIIGEGEGEGSPFVCPDILIAQEKFIFHLFFYILNM